MTYIVNHNNALFDRKEAKRIFDENAKYLNCPIDFKDLVESDWFFLVINNIGKAVGICYILCEQIENKESPFYSGAFDRKTHKEVVEAHRLLLELLFKFYKRVYTWTPHLHAQIFNIKAGMKRLKNNVFYMDKKDFMRSKIKWVVERKKVQLYQQ